VVKTEPEILTAEDVGSRWVVRALVLIVGVHLLIVAANFSSLMELDYFDRAFNINAEATFNAWLSSALLLTIGLLAGISAYVELDAGQNPRIWKGWTLVSAGFIVLSVDETVSLHEMMGRFVDRYLDVSFLPGGYKWVLVVGPLAFVVALLLGYWLATAIGRNSVTTRLALIALGLWVSVPLWEAISPTLGEPLWLVAIEESCEVIGEVLFLLAVLIYLRGRLPIRIGDPTPYSARR